MELEQEHLHVSFSVILIPLLMCDNYRDLYHNFTAMYISSMQCYQVGKVVLCSSLVTSTFTQAYSTCLYTTTTTAYGIEEMRIMIIACGVTDAMHMHEAV